MCDKINLHQVSAGKHYVAPIISSAKRPNKQTFAEFIDVTVRAGRIYALGAFLTDLHLLHPVLPPAQIMPAAE